MNLFTAIVPCYNEEENIDYFYQEFMRNKEFFDRRGLAYELIYVDDGSGDHTADKVRALIAQDPNVRLLSFSRNFGKEAAMYAGLQKARGEYVAIMDADLQDPPSLLPAMFGYLDEGYDQAATRRVTRTGEPPIRSFFARMFYALINRYTKTEIVDGARDFRLMKRKVVDAILQVTEYNRFSKGIFSWVGYKTKWMEFENVERVHGETKWNFWSLFVYAIDGIVGFTTVPLNVAGIVGMILSMVAIAAMLFIWLRALVFGDPTPGWPSMVMIVLLVSGIQLLALGIIGQYLAKTYLEVKHRPIYLLDEDTAAPAQGPSVGTVGGGATMANPNPVAMEENLHES